MYTIYRSRQIVFGLNCAISKLNHLTASKNPARNYSSTNEQKVYEIRTYSINFKDVRNFIDVTKRKFNSRLKHSEMIGYWQSELGGLNEIVSIWTYDSLLQRAEIRQRLAKDSEFMDGYIKLMAPSIASQTNTVTMTMPWFPDVKKIGSQPGAFSLDSWHLNEQDPEKMYDSLKNYQKKVEGEYEAQLMGAFRTVIGNLKIGYLLWHYKNVDTPVQIQCDRVKDHSFIKSSTEEIFANKILIPVQFDFCSA